MHVSRLSRRPILVFLHARFVVKCRPPFRKRTTYRPTGTYFQINSQWVQPQWSFTLCAYLSARSRANTSVSVKTKFHYTDPNDPNDPDLRSTPLVRAGLRQSQCGSVRVRAGPVGSGRTRVVEFSFKQCERSFNTALYAGGLLLPFVTYQSSMFIG